MVGIGQRAVRGDEILRVEDRLGAAPQEFRAVRAEALGEAVEALYEIVVELDQYFPPRHRHMVTHMVMLSSWSTPPSSEGRPAVAPGTCG